MKKSKLVWFHKICLMLFLFNGCEDKTDLSVSSDKDVNKIIRIYSNLSEEKKSICINHIFNYYQFSNSRKALEFIQEKARQGDVIVLSYLSMAKEFKVDIPLSNETKPMLTEER